MGAYNDVHTLPAQYRMKAHCPGLKGVPGTANQLICYEFICICSTSITALEGKTRKTKLWYKFLHRDPWEKVYKSTESLRNVIHIMGNANQSVWPRIYSLLSPIGTLLIRLVTYWCTDYYLDYRILNRVQEEDSKLGQMIYHRQRLNQRNKCMVNPLTQIKWKYELNFTL